MTKDRILLLAPQPFYSNRGTPMNVRAIAECLGQAGYRVDLLTYPLGEDLELEGVRIIRCAGLPGISSVGIGISFSKLLLDSLLFWKALKLVWQGEYKAFHGIEEGGFMVWLLSYIKPAALVFDMDSSIPEQLQESGKFFWKVLAKPAQLAEKLALQKANVVLTVCESLSHKAKLFVSSDKIVQIEDFPADSKPQVSKQERETLQLQFNPAKLPLLVYTGNFHRSQGIELLLEAVKKANSSMALRLLLVGGGRPGEKDFDRIAERARDSGLEDIVMMPGNRPLEEMPVFMSIADVLVSPRIQGENTPLKIYSYMAAEKALVVTDIYSHTQVLSDETAFLAKPDAASLSTAIIHAISQKEEGREKALKAKKLVDEKYSRESFNTRLLTMYENLLVA